MTLVKPLFASLIVSAALPAAAVDFVEDFSGYANVVSANESGGRQGQVATASAGSSTGPGSETGMGTISGIDGDSLFLTIDTSGVADDLAPSARYGGVLQTTISDAFAAGDLTSANAEDYEIIFDVAAVGFVPTEVTLDLQFREFTPTPATDDDDAAGRETILFNNQLRVTQDDLFEDFVAGQAGDDGIQVRIGLDQFVGLNGPRPDDLSDLVDANRLLFQLATRSVDTDYSEGDGNVLVVDNFGIALIPEPASAALLSLGGLSLLARRRRMA